MSCGMIAMLEGGVDVDKYDAYEIDKYAIKASQHNFPQIEHHGDVFAADFAKYKGYDFLIGGSPCTAWSIAQRPGKREVTASGVGWELFSQYVRALRVVKPRFFIYENNKSMSDAIRASITNEFGFEPICINSALVSAQNRQRLYWCGIRQADGTYRKANIKQPEDRGIMLRDVLDSAIAMQDKSYCVDANEYKGQSVQGTLTKHRRTKVAVPISLSDAEMDYMVRDHAERRWNHLAKPEEEPKSLAVVANMSKGVPYNVCAEPVCVALRGRYAPNSGNKAGAPTTQHFEVQKSGKTNTITSVQKDNLVAEPIRIGTMPRESDGVQTQGQAFRIYSPDGKSATLKANSGGGGGGKTGLYAIEEPTEQNGVYTVKDGMIEVKGKFYPIKLRDGKYLIRKLTVEECMRLQTVPEWYDFSCVSKTQAYKMLGNGWTVEVIKHLIASILADANGTEADFDRQQGSKDATQST